MSTATVTSTSQIRLSPTTLGICPGIKQCPSETLKVAERLLQKNHDEYHVFWRDVAGHNHTVHNLLTRLALGASAADLESGWEDCKDQQRAIPPTDEAVIAELATEEGFFKHIGKVPQYTNYMAFFESEIEKKGYRAVVNEYCFSGTRNANLLLARLFEGAFHPGIHLGFGIEFEQPSIVAEGLAQAATDIPTNIHLLFFEAERIAKETPIPANAKPRNLVDLLHEVRSNEKIGKAARWEDLLWKMRDGIVGRAGKEMATLAAQFQVTPETLERRTAEEISCAAYLAGAAQRAGKARKIDFFSMHVVTSSIFLSVINSQDWISVANKCRFVEWKTRLDLAWYGACGAPPLDIDYIKNYAGQRSAHWDWDELFSVINSTHDDGHLAKFVRALKNGAEASKKFEEDPEYADAFPVKGDLWVRMARMAYDSTVDLPADDKWVPFGGFDLPWTRVPAA
ncbi:hypothetical protein QBC43DRAFT_309838 [Cladorrhinum sp. PSN259]|nr:hypothetical protein QBC43DRAFT_309838 [Cladorrhinum sp. PSN259]